MKKRSQPRSPPRASRVAVMVVLLLSLSALPAFSRTTAIDLKGGADTVIVGVGNVAAAGDVNGDGIPDLLVSRGDLVTEPSEGRVWVVFGQRPMPSRIVLSQLGDQGFVIEGGSEDDDASEIAAAGDVNGDGLDDIIVGAPAADNNARNDSGSAYMSSSARPPPRRSS